MLIKLIKLDFHGDTIVSFSSGDFVFEMRTFWKQFPAKIIKLKPEEFLEIPDELICQSLNIPDMENPVSEYINRETILGKEPKGEKANALFEAFMDPVSSFFNYDRKWKMYCWQQANDHCM